MVQFLKDSCSIDFDQKCLPQYRKIYIRDPKNYKSNINLCPIGYRSPQNCRDLPYWDVQPANIQILEPPLAPIAQVAVSPLILPENKKLKKMRTHTKGSTTTAIENGGLLSNDALHSH